MLQALDVILIGECFGIFEVEGLLGKFQLYS